MFVAAEQKIKTGCCAGRPVFRARAATSHTFVRAVTAPESFGRDRHPWGMIEAMAVLFSTLYWDKKLRIAILTFLTFIALC